VNSWSFFRLQTFIEYKAKELGVPFVKVDPKFTSQECSFCFERGSRNRKSFICRNEECKVFEKERHADINAAFNIGRRALNFSTKRRSAC
jgi:putative transposase